jgi:H+/Cl- antiporter ClcA
VQRHGRGPLSLPGVGSQASPGMVPRAVTGQPVDLVLFSGEAALPQVIAETSAGVLALLVLVKGTAYALSLGAGFRGGPTFPAVTLGVATGVLGSTAADTVPIAVIASVIGWLVATALQQRETRHQSSSAPAS